METSLGAALRPAGPRPYRPASAAGRCHSARRSRLDQLRQHPTDAPRMDERDPRSVQPDARRLVDELEALLACIRQRLVDVWDRDGQVVQSGATPGQELADRGVLPQGTQQLDLGVAGAEEGGLEPVMLARGSVRDLGPEQRRVQADGLVHVVDRHPDVMNLHLGPYY